MMKQKYLALSVAVVVASGMELAWAEGPIDGSVYGKLNVSYQLNDNEVSDSAWALESNASRLGVKGASEINKSMQAVYQAEFEIDADEGDIKGQTLSQRNIYVGLKGGFGEILLGKLDTPLKNSQQNFDQFNDLAGDIKQVMEGENRESNVLQYATPAMGGIAATVAIIPGEEAGNDELDGPADGISASVTFNQNNLYIALAADSDIDAQDIMRFTASYTIADLILSALYQNAEMVEAGDVYANNETEADSMGFSAAYKLGNTTLKFQYVDSDATAKISEGEQTSVGVDYKLAKSTKLFAFLTNQDAEVEADQNSYLGIGLEHKF